MLPRHSPFFEQYLEWAETEMILPVLTGEAEGHTNYPEIPRRVASSSRSCFHPIADSPIVCCHSSIRPSTSHGGPGRIRLCAELEILIDYPCPFLSRGRAFFPFSCNFFLNEASSFEVAVDDLLETSRKFSTENLEVCLQLWRGDSL